MTKSTKKSLGSPYAMFKTDPNLETGEGKTIEYDGFSITIHRAGGGNQKYSRILEAKMKPHRRQIDQGTLSPELNRQMLIETYAEAVIIDWNMADEDGKPIPFTKDNVIKVMTDLPDLFADIVMSATDLRNFRQADKEADAKNSAKS